MASQLACPLLTAGLPAHLLVWVSMNDCLQMALAVPQRPTSQLPFPPARVVLAVVHCFSCVLSYEKKKSLFATFEKGQCVPTQAIELGTLLCHFCIFFFPTLSHADVERDYADVREE